MTIEMRGADQHRIRFGLVFLIIGTILLLWAWGSWIYRAANPVDTETAIAQNAPAAGSDTARAFLLSPFVIIIGLILLLLVLFGGHALIRASRRYRDLANRKRPPPTPADDVWAMNKLRNRDDEL